MIIYSFIFGLMFALPITHSNANIKKVISTAVTTEIIPLQFAHSEDISIDLVETTVEAQDFNGSEFLDNLGPFSEEGVDIYLGSTPLSGISLPQQYVQVNITEIYIFNAMENALQGNGEIYFKFWSNSGYMRYPVSGELSVGDDTTIPLDEIIFEGWLHNLSVRVEVWESDVDTNDYLGHVVYNQTNAITNETIVINSSEGHADVNITVSAMGTKTEVTATELIDGYKPYLFIDDETSGTEEPNGVYGRVCRGFDQETSLDLWALQYFFYWDIETFGTSITQVQLHQYDYEEVLLFLDDDLRPIRIVYDQAQNPVYPEHEFVIYERNPSQTGSFSENVSFSEGLEPFLGTNLTIDYTVHAMSTFNNLVPSVIGGETAQLTIDTFYHAFDKGVGSNETGFDYTVQNLTDSTFKDWYSHLNESLHGSIHNIPVISYTTPEISPFTFDPTNPFKKPYIINAWSNVMDDLEAFSNAQTQDFSLSAAMNLTVTLAVEAALTIEYPEIVQAGEEYTINYSLEMFDDTLILTTDYAMDLNVSTDFWFLSGEFTLIHEGSFTIDIPLGTINGILDSVGVSPQSFVDRIVDNVNEALTSYYLEVEYFTLSPQLLGPVVNTSVRLHFWDIAKDFIPAIVSSLAPPIYPAVNTAFRVLDLLISHIDLQAHFLLETMVTSTVTLSDTGLGHLSQNNVEFNESSAQVPVTLTIDATPPSSELQVTLSNLANGVNLYTDWYFDAGLETPFNYYIDDFTVYIGRYPSYEMYLPSGLIEANVSSIPIDLTIEGIPTSTTSTTTSPPGTTTTTTQAGPGGLLLESILFLGIIYCWQHIKRRRK